MPGLFRYSIGVTGGGSEAESISYIANAGFSRLQVRNDLQLPFSHVRSARLWPDVICAQYPPPVLVTESTRQRHLIECSVSAYLVLQHQNTTSSILIFVRTRCDSVSLHKSFSTHGSKQLPHSAIFCVAIRSTKGIKPREDKPSSQRPQEYGVVMQYQNDREALRCARVARRHEFKCV